MTASRASLLTTATLFCWATVIGIVQAADDLQSARELLLTGKYAEARELFEKLTKDKPVEAAVGIARCQAAVGEYAKALETLRGASPKNEKSPTLPAEIAIRSLEMGDYDAASTAAEQALKLDPNHLAALYVKAELSRLSGNLDDANERYQALVELYNSNDVPDAESLRSIGLAAANFARWNRLSDQFGFLVNELY